MGVCTSDKIPVANDSFMCGCEWSLATVLLVIGLPILAP